MAATISDSVGFKGKNHPADVRRIQDMIDLPVTGQITDAMVERIKVFQAAQAGLTGKSVDGRIDPGGKTLQALVKADFERWGMCSAVLTDADYKAAAANLNVEVALIKAVADVESHGDGFLPSGRPKILFERHLFSEATDNKYDVSHSSISNPTPGGYGAGGEHQYKRLYEAMASDYEAGLMSASWGKFQILGQNYHWAGFTSVGDFVDAMRESEQRHLTAFLNFIKNYGNCLGKLKNKNWTAFALKYNGPNEANDPGGPYHQRLEDAYDELVKDEGSEE